MGKAFHQQVCESAFVQKGNAESGFGAVLSDFQVMLDSAKEVLQLGSVPGLSES